MNIQEIPTRCQCGSAMIDKRASKTKPTQPDFKCVNAAPGQGEPGCQVKPIWLKKDHVWADSVPGAYPPRPALALVPDTPPTKRDDIGEYFGIFAEVVLRYEQLVAEAQGMAKERLASATPEIYSVIAGGIANRRNGR
jgi:hypothetical protein